MLKRHWRGIAGVLVAVAVAVGCWLALGRRPPPPSQPLGYVPQKTVAVAYARVQPLAHSKLLEAVFPSGGGLSKLKKDCGFDPTEGMTDVLAFVAEGKGEGGLGHPGLVARGKLDRERLAKCLEHVVRAEGGTAKLTRMNGLPALTSQKGTSKAVFVGPEAVAIGGSDAVRSVLSAVQGDAPSAAADTELAALWDRVATGRDLAVVADLPERWQKAGAAMLESKLGLHVGAVRAVGVGADVERGLEIGGVVTTAGADRASRAVRDLQAEVEKLRSHPLFAFSVLGTVLRRLQLAADGPDVVFTLKLTEDQVDQLLALMSDTRKNLQGRTTGTVAPDEVLQRASGDGEPASEGSGAAETP